MDTDAARAELAARPPLSAAESSLDAVAQQVASAVSDVAGGLTFDPVYEARSGVCGGPFTGLDGMVTTLPALVAQQSVNDRWPAVLDAARGVAEANGFPQLVVTVDRPDDHSVRFVAPDGAYLDVGSKVTTLVRGVTGCHSPG